MNTLLKREVLEMSEVWDEISPLSSLRIFLGMLSGPADLFGFKLEMMLQILFLSVRNKSKGYSEKSLCE